MQSALRASDHQQDAPASDWYAAYVKHHHERKVADLLARKGAEVFLPQQKVVHRWKDRNKTLFLPLFPSYLFLQCDLSDKFRILSTPGLFFLVENAGRACPITPQEIDSIRRLVNGGLPALAHPFVTVGDRVRVCAGPLYGVTGILTRLRQQYRVVLTVEALQKALSVEVEIENVERIC
jgi:transcription antitermination factor NusG